MGNSNMSLVFESDKNAINVRHAFEIGKMFSSIEEVKSSIAEYNFTNFVRLNNKNAVLI